MSAAMAVAALAAAAFGAGTNISMFHMHQANYSGITNMNTADAAGDAYFTLFEFAVNAVRPRFRRYARLAHLSHICLRPRSYVRRIRQIVDAEIQREGPQTGLYRM